MSDNSAMPRVEHWGVQVTNFGGALDKLGVASGAKELALWFLDQETGRGVAATRSMHNANITYFLGWQHKFVSVVALLAERPEYFKVHAETIKDLLSTKSVSDVRRVVGALISKPDLLPLVVSTDLALRFAKTVTEEPGNGTYINQGHTLFVLAIDYPEFVPAIQAAIAENIGELKDTRPHFVTSLGQDLERYRLSQLLAQVSGQTVARGCETLAKAPATIGEDGQEIPGLKGEAITDYLGVFRTVLNEGLHERVALRAIDFGDIATAQQDLQACIANPQPFGSWSKDRRALGAKFALAKLMTIAVQDDHLRRYLTPERVTEAAQSLVTPLPHNGNEPFLSDRDLSLYGALLHAVAGDRGLFEAAKNVGLQVGYDVQPQPFLFENNTVSTHALRYTRVTSDAEAQAAAMQRAWRDVGNDLVGRVTAQIENPAFRRELTALLDRHQAAGDSPQVAG